MHYILGKSHTIYFVQSQYTYNVNQSVSTVQI